jgi:hypothetical protein
MAKQKKKRNKAYTGQDAKTVRPSVTRVSAVHRNPIHQWWIDNKRVAKPVLIGVAVAIVVVWLIIELFRITSGGLT